MDERVISLQIGNYLGRFQSQEDALHEVHPVVKRLERQCNYVLWGKKSIKKIRSLFTKRHALFRD